MTPTIPPITRNYIEIMSGLMCLPHTDNLLILLLRKPDSGFVDAMFSTEFSSIGQVMCHFEHGSRLVFTARVAKSGPRLFKVRDVVTVVRDVKDWLSLGGPLGQGIVWEVIEVDNDTSRVDHPQLLTLGIDGHVFGTASGWWFCEEGEEG